MNKHFHAGHMLIMMFYYMNTNEIPGELLYGENNMSFSHMKRSPFAMVT